MLTKHHIKARHTSKLFAILLSLALSFAITTPSFASQKTNTPSSTHHVFGTHTKKTGKPIGKLKKQVQKKKGTKKVKKPVPVSPYATYCPSIGTPIAAYIAQYHLPGIGKVCFDSFGTPHFQVVLQPPLVTNIGKGQKLAMVPYSFPGSAVLSSANFIAVLNVPKKGNVRMAEILFLGYPLNPQDNKLHLKQKVQIILDASKVKKLTPTMPLTLLNNWIPRYNSFARGKGTMVSVCAISQYSNVVPASNRPYAEYRFNFAVRGGRFELATAVARHILDGRYLPCNKI